MGAGTWEDFRGGGVLSQSDKKGEGFLTMSEYWILCRMPF